MFTGLIETTGTVAFRHQQEGSTRITIATPTMAQRLRTGDSIAVSGVCLTALDITANQFSADLAAETLARTTLGHLRPGSVVNLELPTPAGSPLGGHIVQGHVDGTATLITLNALHPGVAETDWRMRLDLVPTLTRYVVSQGSITVEGISLTVAAIHGSLVEIAIIPHTYAATTLRTLKPGDKVNIETDILARYGERQSAPAFLVTESYLLTNGY